MTYEEMKVIKKQLEKDLAELNTEMIKHEEVIYKGKLDKAIALLEECGYYYNMYAPIGVLKCYECNASIEVEFGDVIEMLKDCRNELV